MRNSWMYHGCEVLTKIEGRVCVCRPCPPLSLVHLLCTEGAETGCWKEGREAPPDSPFHTIPRTRLRSGYYRNVSWPSRACICIFVIVSGAGCSQSRLGSVLVKRDPLCYLRWSHPLCPSRESVTNDPQHRTLHFSHTSFSVVPLSCDT